MQSSRGSEAGGRGPPHAGGAAEPQPGPDVNEPGAGPDEPVPQGDQRGESARVAAEAAAPGDSQADLSGELARIEDRYRRALADLDNYRKRATREVDRRVAEVRESVLRDWLQIVDSVERAMQMEPEGACYDGLRAILQQMDSVLDRQGAQRIGTLGEQFDPELHEAVAVRPSDDVPDRTIVEVQRSGFAHGDRVIRPAQVVVARTPEHAH
ncbi:MAG: GrpE protein [Acidimicrobiales bacterium]|nr:GrpE protein [Acidimicrobiales bacterium]